MTADAGTYYVATDGRAVILGAPCHAISKAGVKTECFDRDPGWEGRNNRIVPKSVPTVRQDFGYQSTHFAGKQGGEIGGSLVEIYFDDLSYTARRPKD